MNKTELLNKFSKDPEERVVLARALDQMDRAANRSIPCATQFLSPAQRAALEPVLAACGLVVANSIFLAHAQAHGLAHSVAPPLPTRPASMGSRGGPACLFHGGFEGAERTVCVFLPDWQEPDGWEPSDELAAIECAYPPTGAELTHRDLLGGLMGIGLTREKVGDILVGEQAAQLVCLRDAAPIILSQFDQAGRYRLKLREIPLSDLTPAPNQVKVIHDTVSALRLDAVLSSGFSLARAKAADAVTGGRVSLNHRECLKPDKPVEQGDVLTCRGLGKCVLKTVGGQSRKGRIIIEIERYL